MQQKIEIKKQETVVHSIEHRSLFGGTVETFIFGKFPGLQPDMGWVLRKLQKPEDLQNPENAKVVGLLLDMATRFGFTKIYAPIANPHNGQIMNTNDGFKHEIVLNGNEVSNGAEPIVLFRGSNFEGLKIKKGEAFFLPSADCLTVIVQDEFGEVVASHAGRDSLIDLNNPFKENIFKNIKKNLSGDLKKMKVWIGFGILAKSFVHELTGAHSEINLNRYKLIRYAYDDIGSENIIMGDLGEIDTFELAKRQAVESGMAIENIEIDDSINTFTDNRFYSHRAGGEDKLGRNGVFVFRTK